MNDFIIHSDLLYAVIASSWPIEIECIETILHNFSDKILKHSSTIGSQ